jgi:adenylate kinase family enzyme
MKKILVIGSGGAGKTTFATQLGETLGINVIHLDALYWQPGWVEPPKEEWAATVDALISRDAWIIDGNYSGTLERRLAACDTVVFLDLPTLTCVWRVCKRVLHYGNTTRPDMAAGCPEHFSLQFLLWVWNYRRRTRPRIIRLLRQYGNQVKVIWLQSAAEVAEYARAQNVAALTEREQLSVNDLRQRW